MTDELELGYTLSCEEHGPNELVDQARRAEEAGFDFLSISDHFHPWVSAQGESPFVWSTLGGVATATEDIDVGVGVTAPIMRIHPVNVAQATATVADMFDGRFTFGVGTGELLNEHVTAEQWPEHAVRLSMLKEAVEVIRELWTGEQTSFHGEFYDVQNARLFTLPDENPPIVVSAFGERAAQAAADFGDGIWSVGPQDVVETWEEAGGEGPRYTQLHACVASSVDEAAATVHERWPNSALPGELAAELPTTAHFEQACEMVSEEDVREGSITLGRDADEHIESIQESVDAGYDHVYVHQIGDDQEVAIEFYESEVLPSFR
ncbi:TIGR03557 family F420-dependent LLM class oxidoreductase [Halomarina litorea]|uniref:TIGR03557 family F420-dependent LLM class oxidoreductase n=1 Tax=Halomarina litorea TaxID=2961595 RepID=UPI0020C240C7|nr:TIGR03557 family F420-dependent LLM class oxidoreductase [Halomarina sp. BCD28]